MGEKEMNKDLLDYIKTLSLNDTKNLSAKGLKAAEEVGEMAKKILPYNNEFATRHRFVLAKDILEEVADVMLSAMSVAYDLNFTHENIEQMLMNKSRKWAGLQNNESKIVFPCP